MYDFIREMTDYELQDLIINVFNSGRMSAFSEERHVAEEVMFDVDEYLGEFTSKYYLN